MDILATGDGSALIQCFAKHEDVAEILAQGDTRAAVRLRAGLQVDLRVVPSESYGAALHYFTGSKAHNIAIRDWNNAHASGTFRLLAGIEVDILEDGALDLPDDVLAELDLVVASIHDHLGLDGERQTVRLIKAMENPRVQIIGHPTGRLLGERAPYALDMERLLVETERCTRRELNPHDLAATRT